MRTKMILKQVTDIAMTILLLLLMAYSLIGEEAHEWIGIGMFVLFVIHHMLNCVWGKNLLKGKYTPLRIWQTALVLTVLVCMAGSMISGVVLSRYALSFLSIRSGYRWAEKVHLLSAYWGLIMMSLHIGFHVSVMAGMTRKYMGNTSVKHNRLLRIAAAVVAVYGVVAFGKRGIGRYLFLKDEFVFFDFEEPILFFLIDYVAIMVLFAWIGHYVTEFLKHRVKKR